MDLNPKPMRNLLLPLMAAGLLSACTPSTSTHENTELAAYFDHTGRDDAWTGGARRIPVETPLGTFHVWTKRIGNNPALKVFSCTEVQVRHMSTLSRLTVISPVPASNILLRPVRFGK